MALVQRDMAARFVPAAQSLPVPTTLLRPTPSWRLNGTPRATEVSNHMKSAVISEGNLEALRNLAIENGMVPLWDSCCNLVVKGVTSIQELMSLNIE